MFGNQTIYFYITHGSRKKKSENILNCMFMKIQHIKTCDMKLKLCSQENL